MNPSTSNDELLRELKDELTLMARARGFEALGVADVDLGVDAARLDRWLDAGLHGEMGYMSRHGTKRTRPSELVPGTLRVLSARMNYFPSEAAADEA